MKIVEVQNNKHENQFLQVARDLYKMDPNWICPLDNDIRNVFNPLENSYFSHGQATRFILENNNNVIGRIAAFIDKKTADNSELPAGGCGFFECVNDQAAADLLFNAAKEWLQPRGMQAMDGPINFGETNKYWGLLVDGYSQPAYQIAYNHPYYQKLFEDFGFKIYYKQEGFHFYLDREIPPRFWKIASWVAKKPDYSFEHLQFSKVEKYVKDFTKVFNQAWADFKEDFEPLEEAYVRNFIMKAKVIAEEKFIWLAYNKGEPIAVYLMIPDVNQIFKDFKGKLNLVNKLKVLFRIRTKKITRARGILMGVIPSFQGLGIESAFIYHLNEVFKKMPHYKEIEFSWVGDFNPAMRKLWLSVGAEPTKQYITYRYLFNREAEFNRYPIPVEK